jgi:hypothetical protein
LPVVAFNKIEVDVPIIILKDLSADQQYLWQMCDTISKGECSFVKKKSRSIKSLSLDYNSQ